MKCKHCGNNIVAKQDIDSKKYAAIKGSDLFNAMETLQIGKGVVTIKPKSEAERKLIRSAVQKIADKLYWKVRTKTVEKGSFEFIVWRIA